MNRGLWKRQMKDAYDSHTHSVFSDGTDTPEQIVQQAFEQGLRFIAISDHDSIEGVPAAIERGKKIGMPVLPAAEFDAKFDGTLHILGLGIDVGNEKLKQCVEQARQSRIARNKEMAKRLRKLGAPILEENMPSASATRLNFALALMKEGHVDCLEEAFVRYIGEGKPAYVPINNASPEEIISFIHAAGGLAVLAHPCKVKADIVALVRRLKNAGLDGLEAYYPTTTPGLLRQHLSLCAQYGLIATCGSDYHGVSRRSATIGCAFEPVPKLIQSSDMLYELCYNKI